MRECLTDIQKHLIGSSLVLFVVVIVLKWSTCFICVKLTIIYGSSICCLAYLFIVKKKNTLHVSLLCRTTYDGRWTLISANWSGMRDPFECDIATLDWSDERLSSRKLWGNKNHPRKKPVEEAFLSEGNLKKCPREKSKGNVWGTYPNFVKSTQQIPRI